VVVEPEHFVLLVQDPAPFTDRQRPAAGIRLTSPSAA
jgi:hypothetical protein